MNENANPAPTEVQATANTAKAQDLTTPLEKAIGGSVNGDIDISSMSELKEKAPEVYKLTLESMARTIIGEQERHQERMREAWKKMRQEGR